MSYSNLNNLASLCDCDGTYFTDLDRHSPACAYPLAVKHATLTTAIKLKIALNETNSRRLSTRINEIESLGKLLTLPVWSRTIKATNQNRSQLTMKCTALSPENNKLVNKITRKLKSIVKEGPLTGARLDAFEWRYRLRTELLDN